MIVDLGIIDVELLKRQARIIGDLAGNTGDGTNTDEEIEILEGVYNLLEHILDKIEEEGEQQMPARLTRTVH